MTIVWVFFGALGKTKPSGEVMTQVQDLHIMRVVNHYAAYRDENVQVNGFVFICDMSDVTMKHMTHWSLDDIRNWNNCWQVEHGSQWPSG